MLGLYKDLKNFLFDLFPSRNSIGEPPKAQESEIVLFALYV